MTRQLSNCRTIYLLSIYLQNMRLDSDVHKRTGMHEEMENEGSDEKASSIHAEFAPPNEAIKPGKTLGLIWKTHLNVALYSCCFWIQLGVLPYLSKKLGANPVVFGYLQTTFAVVQLCGGPLFGRFGDIFGSRAALLLAFGSAAAAYFLLGMASSVGMLFLSRLPSVFMHVMQGSQMIVTDVTDDKDRADALGKLGISYGVGMVIGPTLGGWIIKQGGEQAAAFVSLLFSILSIILVLLWIPKNTKALRQNPDPSQYTGGKSQPKEGVFNMEKLWELLKFQPVVFLLAIRVITGIPFGIFQSMFPVVSMEYFKLEPQQNGLVLSYAGGLSIFVQGFVVGPLSRRFSEMSLLKSAICIIALSNGLLFMVTTVFQFCIVLIPMVAGGGILNVVSTAVITKAVPAKDTGAILGIAMASNSLIRSVSPFFGGIMFEHFGWHSFGALGFVVDVLVALFLFVKLNNPLNMQEVST